MKKIKNMELKRFTVFLKHGENVVELEEDLVTEYTSILTVRNAAVFWEHQNIFTSVNDTLIYNSNTITLEPGYWTFEMIQKLLKQNSIELQSLEHNSTCKIQAKSGSMDLKKFGVLLGFPEDTTLNPNTWKTSPNKVDVNSSMRYVTISANVVDRNKNTDANGKRSRAIATLPITGTQNLNGTVSNFAGLNISSPLFNGTHKRLYFVVGNNANVSTKMSVLLEFEIR